MKNDTENKKADTEARVPFDLHISPMLCTLVKEPPTGPDYLFELKWDGYRIISYVQDGNVRMDSRSGLDCTRKYPPIAKALSALGHNVILDGEVVVFNKEGKPDFDALQLYNGQSTPIQYCVFDILSLNDNDLMEMPLVHRKELLKALIDDNPVFRFSESYEDGRELYQRSLNENLGGIVAKQRESAYSPGVRGKAWLKIPTRKRQDKDPKDVVREIPQEAETDRQPVQTKPALTEDSNWKIILEEKINSEADVILGGHDVHLTNIERNIWKGVNKAALINYYNLVSEYILSHLKNRPLSLHIKNLSATAPGFYIKDMEGMQPEYAHIFTTKRKHKKKGKRDVIDYVVCNNLPTLIYLINLGCVDINPWNSRISDPLHPDFIAIDLDPSDNDFSKAVKTAIAAKGYFDRHKLKAFVKTSGKTGIHIFIPCSGFTYPSARKFAAHICKEIHLLVPDITTIEVSVDHRGDKLFVDFSQNDEADTLAAVYSVRPSKLPTVSTPLEWDELTDDLRPDQFTMFNIIDRLKGKGDLFKGVHNPAIMASNSKILKKLL